LDQSFKGARAFYTVLIFSTLLGIAMDFLNINPVKALFWTAVINGLLPPFLLVGILIVASDRKLMQGQRSSWLSRIVVGVKVPVSAALRHSLAEGGYPFLNVAGDKESFFMPRLSRA
jgi:Mn2+/Fe2+ NRAMP family transporter